MELFSGTFKTLERSMSYSALKHETTVQNIANADTPNYKGKEVSFRHVLNEAMSASRLRTTDHRHMINRDHDGPNVSYSNRQVQYGHNGNNVDIDKEMSDLAANQIYYSTLTERLNGKFNSLQNVIRGGK